MMKFVWVMEEVLTQKGQSPSRQNKDGRGKYTVLIFSRTGTKALVHIYSTKRLRRFPTRAVPVWPFLSTSDDRSGIVLVLKIIHARQEQTRSLALS